MGEIKKDKLPYPCKNLNYSVLNPSRREFLQRSASVLSATAIAPGLLATETLTVAAPSKGTGNERLIWANLIHLSYNMWCVRLPNFWGNYTREQLHYVQVSDFGKPRFFHLGYDEETAGNQKAYSISIVRQHELWWHDFEFFHTTVQAQGCQPWIWSDYAWGHPEEFYEKMPKDVLQSNWYNSLDFDKTEGKYIKTFHELEQHGFDQIPTGSNWDSPLNFGELVDWCRKETPGPRLTGFLQTPWYPTLEPFRDKHLQTIENVAGAILKYEYQSILK